MILMKENVTMKENILKKILNSLVKYIYQKRQIIVYTLMIIIASIYLIYTLGYSSNWAIVVDETRGGSFYRASQQANQLMFQLAIIVMTSTLLSLSFGSMKRKKFYLSNIILTIFSNVMLMVSAVITYYYNGVLSRMYARITTDEIREETYLLHGTKGKSFAIFEIGNVLTVLMIVIAIVSLLFLIGKIRAQKERAKLIQGLVKTYEH
jgi:hypothetical protein